MQNHSYRFPEFMVEQRQRKGWSVAQVARAIGHSQTYVHNLEQGTVVTPRDETQREIARGFGIPLAEVREALGLDAASDPEADAVHQTLNELGQVLRDCPMGRHPAIVAAAKLIASVE